MTLSVRQQQIVDLLCQDNCRKQVAEKLGIARQTVDEHMVRIRGKTRAKTDNGIVAWAYQNKMANMRKPCCPECA